METKEFIDIFSGYIGKITEDDRRIKISNKNRIITYYQSGEVFADQIVLCEIEFDKINKSLNGRENTYRLLGGFGYPPPISEETLRHNLQRFGFKQKEQPKQMQLSIFDL